MLTFLSFILLTAASILAVPIAYNELPNNGCYDGSNVLYNCGSDGTGSVNRNPSIPPYNSGCTDNSNDFYNCGNEGIGGVNDNPPISTFNNGCTDTDDDLRNCGK
jgi:hypothetical protein